MHFSLVRPKRGGFGHIYGYWSPGPTIVIQEDVLGPMRAGRLPAGVPEVQRADRGPLRPARVLPPALDRDAALARRAGDSGLAGLELTVEANGPLLADLVPVLRQILERSRLILFVDHGFEHLAAVLRQLPVAGLYLLLRDDQVRSDDEFRSFVEPNGGAIRELTGKQPLAKKAGQATPMRPLARHVRRTGPPAIRHFQVLLLLISPPLLHLSRL